uniref:Uncharacterized protein n=1 Tax=Seriola lalandi dorsalis TaxID=1841481 RepID=A0A3B4Y1S8_SERLL
MCTGKCSRCIAGTLYPLIYVKDGHITEEVKYMGGIIGRGVTGELFFLLPVTDEHDSGVKATIKFMFLSIVFASVGVSGALYSFSVAAAGLLNGPLCKVNMTWTTPFKNSNFTHLSGDTYWQECTEPKNVVQFNMGLFITLIAASSLQGLLCAIQMISGLFGCLCGTETVTSCSGGL